MIETDLARKFIEQVTQYTQYNINIMNDQGIIIASRDESRVGTFHEVAYYIVTGKEDMVVTSGEEDYPGVRPGINMVINIEGRREGVVGITGEPAEIKPVALITKMAIEAMLKYEKQQEEIRRRRDKKEHFTNLLIHVEHSDPGELRSMAHQLNYSENIVRIPILCKTEEVKAELILDMLKHGPRHGREDISAVLNNTHVLIFKTMKTDNTKLFADYKYLIGDYLSTVLMWLRQQEKQCRFYIGSFQENFTQYYYAYRHCVWLEEKALNTTAAFFYDYTGNYVRSVVPFNELQWMFQTYEKEMNEDLKQSFIEIAGALIKSNYNLVTASKELFVHKNTLLYRYGKIKDYFNINPIEAAKDRFFMENFYSFLTKEH
ncbi:CdaR family transcriptional regulator [Lacrimispora defluvii]|uniref:CdaR family transcriptional regulator n=1 Tax=Lacrimispora defluvii TaxID=2719233 RepID=A0ABX1VT60_9FIRM|nr:sugar diacid recognition domain-containing protein [Lacrimispora defluvii]NNJ29393.1 CdaR family transcriptional regulator [Lacrimispora defluvii]